MAALEYYSCKRLRATGVVFIALMLTAAVVPLSIAEAPSSEWMKTYSGWVGNSVIQTVDGGYAIAGSTVTESQAVLIKTDSSGDVQWQKEYGTDVFGGSNNAISVVQISDLGYLLFGYGGYLVKTDSEGNIEWTKDLRTYGLCAGIKTSDGSFVMVGNKLEFSENVAWLLKTDTEGDILWNKTFTGGYHINDVVETHDRGVALAGNEKNDFWLAKIDSNSNLQWTQNYAAGDISDLHSVFSLATTNDGGFVLAGAGYWSASGGIIPWLLKINSNGHQQWVLPYGHIVFNSFSSVVQTGDYGYILVLGNNASLLRTDSSGSDKWQLAYADASGTNTGIIPLIIGVTYNLPSIIQTKDGGYAVLDTIFGNTIRLTRISPESDIKTPVISILSPKNEKYETSGISLTFIVDEPTSWLGYSLDGQETVTVAGNTTLVGLADGEHTITVYATDISGNDGSETISFTTVAPFPIEWIITSIVVVAAACGCLLFYFKKKRFSTYKQQGLMKCLKNRLISIANNRIARNLIIISLCIFLILVQFFFPYVYFSSLPSNSNSFEVGISYIYEQDPLGKIYDEVARIKDLGFQVIRINLVCNSEDPNNFANTITDVFFGATQNLGMRVALIIHNDDTAAEIDYYLSRWGSCLYCIQILNEPELSSSWDIGALFTDDEIISKFEQAYSIIESHQLSVLLYTNFEVGFIVRTNLPIKFSEKLDFVGYDVFMESFLALSPNFIQILHEITNKDVIITELGMSSNDEIAQSGFILRGLNLFKNMGLKDCWIVYWNSVGNAYGIRGKLAEQTVSEWIAENS